MEERHLFGREVITIDEVKLTDTNILDILDKVMATHTRNRSEIQYLWDYYKGKQPILGREKKVRPEICNRIVENRANEIVSFKVGYLCGEPIQYIGRSGSEAISKAISELNEMMFSENKATQDKRVVEWQAICGTAYRLVLPDTRGGEDDAPFEMYTLDPRDTLVAYSNEVGNKPLLAVKYCTTETNDYIYSIYSANHFWKIKNKEIIETKDHALGIVPIIEYPANTARLGAFEMVLPLLDEINNIASNRMDGIEQFIQAFMKFINCEITKEEYLEFLELGAIKVKSHEGLNADVDMVSSELNQSQTQIAKDDAHSAVIEITGMPNRNGGSSTSDTGQAVVLRDGWTLAESRAKDSELMFKESEQQTLKLILRIIRDTQGMSDELYALRLKDIALQFTRRNYENIQSKAQVLTQMLAQNKIHPRLAFAHCGMFTDPEDAYRVSEQYAQKQAALMLAQVNADNDNSDETDEEE
jgi:SPP1 family phage portal protein